MGIVAGATFRLKLLAACFIAVVFLGSWSFAAEEPAPAPDKADAAKKDEAKDGKDAAKGDKEKKDKKEDAEETAVPEPPAPTAEEIAKRDARAEEYKTLGEKFFKFPVTGSLYTQYKFQRATNVLGSSDRAEPDSLPDNFRPNHESSSDQDIHQYLTMDFGDPAKHPAVGHFDLQVDNDLDGYKRRRDFAGNVDRRDPLMSIEDTFGPTYVRLDSAYLDFNHLPGVAKLRVGRQYTYETPEVLEFDGLRLDTQPFFGDKELVFSFYGGRSVHNYEITSSDIRQNSIDEGMTAVAPYENFTDASILHDVTCGAAVEGRPWDGGRMRLDWQHLTDQLYDPYVLSTLATSDEVTLNVWHTFRSQRQGQWSDQHDGWKTEGYVCASAIL